MADAGSFNADLGVNLQFNVDGAGLVEMSKTIKEISKGKDLQHYWKDVETATDNAGKAIQRYSRNVNSQGLAESFLKQINALKAITQKENLSELFPNMDINFDELIESAKKVAPRISSEFSVSNFEQAFKTFDLLRDKGIELGEVFSQLADYVNVVKRNSELGRENSEFRNLLGDADIEKLKKDLGELQKLRSQAEREFESFLNINKIERKDFWGDEKFSEYFTEIRNGSMTATDAIARFKTEYGYLLEESFKTNGDTFGIEQLQSFANKLDIIFHQVEETSNKINDIISNGVIAKSVENLSVDGTLSDSQRSMFGNLLQDEESLKEITSLFKRLIEESNAVKNTTLFDEEQFNRLLILFGEIESSLSSMKTVFVDVGDGEEFSPLLKMINNVQSSISELATSVKGIGLNMNIDVGSDSEMEAKVQSKIANALQAYQRLFDAIKMSGAGGSVINTNFFEFDINQYDTMMGKLQAYKKFIDNMRKEAKTQYNGKDILYQSVDKTYWTQASAAMGQVTKAFNEMNVASDTNPLKDLFGSGDLSEVISQLGLIVAKLEEISTTASSFKNVFKEGFNVTASVEEIDKLTNRVKELEDELAKIKLNPVNVDKSNISSDVVTPIIEGQNKLQEELKETENTITKVYRAYNKMSGMVGEAGISWFSDDLDTMKTYMNHYKDRELVSGDIDINKLLSIDAQGSKHNAITYLGDYSDEASIKITDLYNKIQQLKSELSKAPNDALTQQLKELELEYDKLSEDTSNLYGTHTTNWFAIQAKEAGYLGIAIKNVVDDYDGLIDKPTTTIALFDTNLLENQEKITSRIRENVENIKGLNFDVSKAVETDANSFVNNISPEDINDEIREIQEFNSLMKLTQMTSEELGSSLREVFSYAHENPDVLDNLYDYNPNLVDVFDKNTNIGKYFDELVSSTNWDVDESSLESIYLDFAKKLQDYENKYIESVKQKLNIISNNIQSDNMSTEETISSNNSIQNELKETQEQAEQTAKAVQDVSETQIEDVFQGDIIDQATTSAKELDKTLEQVNIPTDSFDEVLSKLDLTKSELKEIVKITKQSVSDSEGKFHDSYTLKDKRGSTEIYGLSSNTEKGQLLRSNIVGYDAKAEAQESKRIIEENIRLNKAYYDSKKQEEAEYQRLRAKYLAEGKAQEEKYYADLKKSKESTLKSYQDQINSFNNQIPKKPIEGQRSDKFEGLVQNYKNAIEEARKYLDTLGDSPVTKEVKDEWERLISVIKKAKEEMDAVPNAARGSDALSRGKEIDTITKYLNKFTGISKQARRELNGLLDQLQSGDPSVNVKKIHERFLELTVAERNAGREARNLFDIFKDKKIYSFLGQAASMFSFYDLINLSRQGFNVIKDLDSALTEMKKVSDETTSSLKEFQSASFDVAKQVGTTALEIQNSAADFMRLGYSLKEASKLSEDANIYANVGDMDIAEATEHMISSIQAWQSEFSSATEASTNIIDRYNEIGNRFAITSADIGSAMERSAAALKAAGNTLNESIGIITAGNLIQQDADTTANALKVLSLRIRGSKADLESMGESVDDLVDSTSKMREQIQSLTGIDIMIDENTFKSTAKIIQEIGAEWSKLTDVSKAATLELLAGKTRASTVAGLIENYQTIEEVIKAAEESENSARIENEKYIQSIEGRLNLLQSQAQEFWYKVIDSDTIKNGITLLTDLLELGTNIVDTFGVLPTIMTGIGAGLAVKNVGVA